MIDQNKLTKRLSACTSCQKQRQHEDARPLTWRNGKRVWQFQGTVSKLTNSSIEGPKWAKKWFLLKKTTLRSTSKKYAARQMKPQFENFRHAGSAYIETSIFAI